MASVVLSGDTSGTVTLSAPLVAGSNTVTVPAATGGLSMLGGEGQTWASYTVGSARVSGTTYTNSTGKPILVAISQRGGSSVYTYVYVNGVQITQVTTTTATTAIFPNTFIVPNGQTYSVTGTIDYWAELR